MRWVSLAGGWNSPLFPLEKEGSVVGGWISDLWKRGGSFASPLVWPGLLLALLLAGCSEDRPPAPVNGQVAPNFTLERLDGARVTLPADMAGKVVAVRFWADWCPYCRKEMAELQPVHSRLESQGLEILAVNVAQDRDTARRFAESIGIAYPVLLDTDGATARAYGVQALPVTWLVDRRGVLRGKIVGEATAELFEIRVKALLDER